MTLLEQFYLAIGVYVAGTALWYTVLYIVKYIKENGIPSEVRFAGGILAVLIIATTLL